MASLAIARQWDPAVFNNPLVIGLLNCAGPLEQIALVFDTMAEAPSGQAVEARLMDIPSGSSGVKHMGAFAGTVLPLVISKGADALGLTQSEKENVQRVFMGLDPGKPELISWHEYDCQRYQTILFVDDGS